MSVKNLVVHGKGGEFFRFEPLRGRIFEKFEQNV